MKNKNQKYSFCEFGENYIIIQLTLMHKTAPKINLHSDIELLHKTRVSARKLNVSLVIFHQCIRKKIYSDFKKETSILFKNLGKARDLDVQIQNLGEVAAKLRSKEKLIGINRLIWRKIQSRENIQSKLEKSLKRFIKKDFLSKIDVLFKKKNHDKILTKENFTEIFEKKELKKSCDIRLSKILSFDPLQSDGKIVPEMHKLRINVKKLRYVFEIFQPVLDRSSSKTIIILKNLQETLGIIHDCDVWIEYLPKFLKEENEKTISFFGYIPSENSIESGIEYLINHHLKNRKLFFDKFLKDWNNLNSENFWNNILTSTESS